MNTNDLTFFTPFREIEKHTTRLPHWQQPGATYFVTFRLADSLPHSKLQRWAQERRQWQKDHPAPWSEEDEAEYHERFSTTMEQWLDRGHGSCALRDRSAATVVHDALLFFENQRSVQHGFVIMPNHVHALFTLVGGVSLEDTMKSWKGFTARKINALLGTVGEFWQRDYFDRLIRDATHFWNCARYVRRNPVKAKLRQGEFVLFEAEWVAKALGSLMQ